MNYNCALTVDCVVFSGDSILLIKRKNPPFQGCYALPGGFVDNDETVEAACIREAKEETNLELKGLVLSGVYSNPHRDPRGRSVSFAFLANADLNMLKAGDDAVEAELINNWQVLELAFDHKQIIMDALKIRNTISHK